MHAPVGAEDGEAFSFRGSCCGWSQVSGEDVGTPDEEEGQEERRRVRAAGGETVFVLEPTMSGVTRTDPDTWLPERCCGW